MIGKEEDIGLQSIHLTAGDRDTTLLNKELESWQADFTKGFRQGLLLFSSRLGLLWKRILVVVTFVAHLRSGKGGERQWPIGG